MCAFVLCLAAAGQAPTLIPDERYEPAVGDVVRVYRRENRVLRPVPALSDVETFQEWERFNRARDETGVKEVEKKGGLFYLDPGTQVRVIEANNTGMKYRRELIFGTDQYHTVEAGQPTWWRFYVLRVLEGPYKEKQLLVDKVWVKRCQVVTPKKKGAPAGKTKKR